MTSDKYVSPYVNLPRRDLCACKRGPAREETGLCESCELEAQANVTDLDEERKFRRFVDVTEGGE